MTSFTSSARRRSTSSRILRSSAETRSIGEMAPCSTWYRPLVLAGALHGQDVQRLLDDADHRAVAGGVAADMAGIDVGQVEATEHRMVLSRRSISALASSVVRLLGLRRGRKNSLRRLGRQLAARSVADQSSNRRARLRPPSALLSCQASFVKRLSSFERSEESVSGWMLRLRSDDKTLRRKGDHIRPGFEAAGEATISSAGLALATS